METLGTNSRFVIWILRFVWFCRVGLITSRRGRHIKMNLNEYNVIIFILKCKAYLMTFISCFFFMNFNIITEGLWYYLMVAGCMNRNKLLNHLHIYNICKLCIIRLFIIKIDNDCNSLLLIKNLFFNFYIFLDRSFLQVFCEIYESN